MAVAVLSVNAGQGCALLTRLLVHNSVRKQFVETAVATAAHFKIGDAADPSVMMGPLIRESQRAKVEHFIGLGRDEGARLVHGGGRPQDPPKGFFTQLTPLDRQSTHLHSSHSLPPPLPPSSSNKKNHT